MPIPFQHHVAREVEVVDRVALDVVVVVTTAAFYGVDNTIKK